MSETTAPGRFEPPSGKKILVGTLVALVVALIVLVTWIWPAEYGRDPTGIGALLGIKNMSMAATRTIEIVDTVGGNEILREVEIPEFGEPVPLPNPAVYQAEAEPPRTVTMQIELGESGETEVKAVLTEGKAIVFDWEVDDGIVYTDFHGHTPEFGEDFWVRYQEDQQGAASGHGSLVAPFSGEHGWYWVNIEDHPITITLTITGYFNEMIDYSDSF